MARSLGWLFTLAILVAACSSTDVKNSENVEEIYKEAVSLVDKGRYLEAGELLNEVRRRFPQSRYAALSELRSADMQFKQDNFTEAAAAYGTFVELYPTHADAPYALYQKALSFLNDAPDEIARDQIPANDAAGAADQLIHRYPNTEYVPKAREIFQKSRLKLAEKEAYVARFYQKREAKLAAYRRWAGILERFPDLKEFPNAKALLDEAATNAEKLKAEAMTAQSAQQAGA